MSKGKIIATSLITGVLIAAVVWVAWGSPWLRTKSVTVTIASAAAEPPSAPTANAEHWRDPTLKSRVGEVIPDIQDRPLVSVDTAAIARKVRTVQGVLDVDVRRGWPNTIAVLVRPRSPVAVFLVNRTGRQIWQLVDTHAVVVAERTKPPAGWVVLGVSPATTGGKVAMDVWSGLPAILRGQITVMSARNSNSAASVEFTLRGGARVVWGDVRLGNRKAEVLEALLKYPARVYDVSAPDVPTTMK